MVVFEPNVHLADVALRYEAAERGRVRARHGGVREDIFFGQELFAPGRRRPFRRPRCGVPIGYTTCM